MKIIPETTGKSSDQNAPDLLKIILVVAGLAGVAVIGYKLWESYQEQQEEERFREEIAKQELRKIT